MKLSHSVWSSYLYDLSPEEQILRYLECGFTASEFSDEHGVEMLSRGKADILALRRFADEHGFCYPQGHLQLRADICRQDAVEVLKPWLDMFLELGIRSAVLHAAGGVGLTREEQFARRVETLGALSAHIKGSDMTICLENLRGADVPLTSGDLLSYIDAVGSAHLGICLDTGHLQVVQKQQGVTETQREFILNAGKHLKALHIADNDGSYDQHIAPYGRGNIDWDMVMGALKEVGYDRLFNLEIPGENRAPLAVRLEKLKYFKTLCSLMCDAVAL